MGRRSFKRLSAVVGLPVVGVLIGIVPTAAAPPIEVQGVNTTILVSVGMDGAQADGHSSDPSLTDDGRYVAFVSAASNLVPGDTNNADDIFVRDLGRGTTTRVSVSSAGEQAIGTSENARIAGGGRYVVFQSLASNLVPDDTNGVYDIFVHDLVRRTTERVSLTPQGGQSDGSSLDPSISRDGSGIAFQMRSSTNLQSEDMFYRDRVRGYTERVVTLMDGGVAPGQRSQTSAFGGQISPNGWRIGYLQSDMAGTLQAAQEGTTAVSIYRRSVNAVTVGHRVRPQDRFEVRIGGLSFDGRFTAFSISEWGHTEVSVFDASQQIVRPVPGIYQGRSIWDGTGGTLRGITGDGSRFLVTGRPPEGVPEPSSAVYLIHRASNTTRLVSLTERGTVPNNGSYGASMTSSASHVGFHSDATDVVSGDINGKTDIFVRRLA